MICGAAQNLAVIDFMWQWFLENFENLEELELSQLGRVIVSLVLRVVWAKKPR